MIKAIAVDDDPIALKVIENFCSEMKDMALEKTFGNPLEALDYVNSYPVDLVFLDIDMPHISGLELSKKIRPDTMIIFSTTHTEYAIEGFNLDAVDYITKPYSFERFQKAVAKASVLINAKKEDGSSGNSKFLFVRADFTLHKIDISEIHYIEALDDYLKIFIDGKKTLVVRMTMSEILTKLPEKDFVRVRRSYIVAVSRIKSIKGKTVVLADKEIDIGPKFEKEVFEKFSAGK